MQTIWAGLHGNVLSEQSESPSEPSFTAPSRGWHLHCHPLHCLFPHSFLYHAECMNSLIICGNLDISIWLITKCYIVDIWLYLFSHIFKVTSIEYLPLPLMFMFSQFCRHVCRDPFTWNDVKLCWRMWNLGKLHNFCPSDLHWVCIAFCSDLECSTYGCGISIIWTSVSVTGN